MKYIQKQSEPQSFTEWKAKANEDWQPTYEELRNPEKHDVFQALLDDQGNICCYCGMRIIGAQDIRPILEDYDACHIEHLQPQHRYSELALDYSNMLASCQAEESKRPRPPIRCGQKKSDWYDPGLMVSPLHPNCETAFSYTIDGQILAVDSELSDAATTTIHKLGLDIDKLNSMRKVAIEGVLEGIEELSEAEIAQLADGFSKRDRQGQYVPFCFAIIHVLRQYLG